MTISTPEPGELVRTVSELVTAVNSGGIPRSILVAFPTSSITVTAGGSIPTLLWNPPSVVSPDVTITNGNLEFLTSGLYVISLDYAITTSVNFAGQVQIVFGYNAVPDDSFLSWGNNAWYEMWPASQTNRSRVLTLPPDRFDAGNIIDMTLGQDGMTAGSYTWLNGSMLYVTRLA